MDDYEVSDVKGPPGRRRQPGSAWNALAILALVLTGLVVTAFVFIYLNPTSPLNPFPPPTSNPLLVAVSATIETLPTSVPSLAPTSATLSPTETPEATQIPAATPTLAESGADNPEGLLSNDDEYAFGLRQGSPAAIDGATFHPDAGCNWLGVAGQANSLNGEAVRGLFVHLGGTLNGKKMDSLTMTGLAPQFGQGGFEITITDKLISSNSSLWVQLLDAQNLPLSNRVYFSTFDDCTKNLVIVYFDQIR